MPYQIKMRDDGILSINFAGGALEHDKIDDFVRDLNVYLDAVTPEAPLRILALTDRPDVKLSSSTRKAFANINLDPRIGETATAGMNRYVRVLVSFVLKATGRDNIRFFETEEEALAWLQA